MSCSRWATVSSIVVDVSPTFIHKVTALLLVTSLSLDLLWRGRIWWRCCPKRASCYNAKKHISMERHVLMMQTRFVFSVAWALMGMYVFTGWDAFQIPKAQDLFLQGCPTVIHASWIAVCSLRGGLTRRRLILWGFIIAFPTLAVALYFRLSLAMIGLLHVMMTLALDPGFVVAMNVFLAASLAAADRLKNPSWGWFHIAREAMFRAVFPLLIAKINSHLLSSASARATSSEETGEAFFSLLSARYDTLLELDADTRIMKASGTFFAMAPRQNLTDTSNAGPRIPSSEDSPRAPMLSAPNSLVGQRFADMLTSDEDREKLAAAMGEQMELWKLFHQDSCADDEQAGLRNASVLHVCLRTQAFRNVKFRLYCAVCYDALRCHWRFTVGACTAEDQAGVPYALQNQGAGMVLREPVLATVTMTFDATHFNLSLVEPCEMNGQSFPVGTALSVIFSPPFVESFEEFLQKVLAHGRVGQKWEFDSFLHETGSDEPQARDDVSVEIKRDTRGLEHSFVLDVDLTVTTRLDKFSTLKRRPKRCRASSSSRPSSALAGIGEEQQQHEDHASGRLARDDASVAEADTVPEADAADAEEHTQLPESSSPPALVGNDGSRVSL